MSPRGLLRQGPMRELPSAALLHRQSDAQPANRALLQAGDDQQHEKHPSFLSFRSASAARESGIHEHRTMNILEMQVFMASGPAPAGRPGMTGLVSSEFLPSLAAHSATRCVPFCPLASPEISALSSSLRRLSVILPEPTRKQHPAMDIGADAGSRKIDNS
jgi:hypothetical protein